VTISHTPGLRIRFVRFRQTVWGVVHIDTVDGEYTGSERGRSNGRVTFSILYAKIPRV
jgi:hypothetical protein